MKYRAVTCETWRSIPAGTRVPDGYGSYMTAPDAPGTYTLYELADENNCHAGWKWEMDQ